MLAGKLGIKHHVHVFDPVELRQAVPSAVRIMKTFDPVAVRSSVTIYLALADVRASGFEEAMTGDGGDECFLGYDHLYHMPEPELKREIEDLLAVERFASNVIGDALGVKVKQPFLDPRVKELARHIGPEYKIRDDRGARWGKWVVRKAFEEELPQETVWRPETVIERGSGTINLTRYFDGQMEDSEFAEEAAKFKESDGITIRNKEQLYYYRAYRATLGVPPTAKGSSPSCPDCNSELPVGSRFCRVCGHLLTT
jgi:asparagine synthase (glutamine-hydrolysing)